MKTVVDALAVVYADEGSGPVLLLLHGWADNLHTFDKLAGALTGFRIVRLDMPGFGGSERPEDAWGAGEYAAFVARFLEKLDIARYTLVGHSFGGRVAIKGVGTGVLGPEKLVLIAAAGIKKERTIKNQLLRLAAKAGKSLTLVPPFSAYRHRIRKRLYQSIGSDYFASGSMRDIFIKVVGEDLSAFARTIRIPTLLIWGRDDASTPLSDGERIHEAIPNSRLKVLDGSHFIHLERSQETATLIKEFL